MISPKLIFIIAASIIYTIYMLHSLNKDEKNAMHIRDIFFLIDKKKIINISFPI